MSSRVGLPTGNSEGKSEQLGKEIATQPSSTRMQQGAWKNQICCVEVNEPQITNQNGKIKTLTTSVQFSGCQGPLPGTLVAAISTKGEYKHPTT
jgi:hypothetical protein